MWSKASVKMTAGLGLEHEMRMDMVASAKAAKTTWMVRIECLGGCITGTLKSRQECSSCTHATTLNAQIRNI